MVICRRETELPYEEEGFFIRGCPGTFNKLVWPKPERNGVENEQHEHRPAKVPPSAASTAA